MTEPVVPPALPPALTRRQALSKATECTNLIVIIDEHLIRVDAVSALTLSYPTANAGSFTVSTPEVRAAIKTALQINREQLDAKYVEMLTAAAEAEKN